MTVDAWTVAALVVWVLAAALAVYVAHIYVRGDT